MKKALTILAAAFFVLLSFAAPVRAAQSSDQQLIDDGLAQSGMGELFSLIPDEGRDFFADGFSQDTLDSLSPNSVFSRIFSTAKERIGEPLRLLLSLCGVLLLSALAMNFSDNLKEGNLQKTFSAAAALTVTGLLADSVIHIVTETADVIEDLSLFMLSFIPVFAGAAAAAGRPASAMVYYSTVFSAVQFFSQIARGLILPLISIFLALGFTGAVTDVIKVDAISKSVRSTAGWLLSLCLTVFISLLTIKGLVSASADGVTVRAAKFVLSSFVPVVGGALSEAYSSLFGCMGVIRSTIGVFGILVMASVFLPVIIRLSMYLAALNLAAILADVLSQGRPAAVLRTCSSAVSVLMGVVICYGMMILVTVTVVLLLGTAS
ncbi:MAG: hypothetical protein HFE45_00700 [Oscillospiraceae bacterium]|jgi:stage III sporulation protein AE|nr:hypothetical protein [Oscillospiraceae bacterium]